MPPVPLRALEVAKGLWSSLGDSAVLWKVRGWAGVNDYQISSCYCIVELSRPLPIARPVISFPSFPNTPTSTIISSDTDKTSSTLNPQSQAPDFWITYHQAPRTHKRVTPQVGSQLLNVSDATNIFDLEGVLDHVFNQGLVDPKWRSTTWWEDCTSVRLENCDTVQDLLARGAGSTPETALHLIISKPYILLSSRRYVDLMSPAII